MDRASLEVLLERGLSLTEIGRRFDRHEATVSYWMSFGLSRRGARSIARLRSEASKCVLLCSNCHTEVEAGTAKLS